MIVWINERFFEEDRALVPIFDYRYGVFESLVVQEGRIFQLSEHIERLFRSAKAIGLHIKKSKEEVKNKVIETARKSGLKDAYVRIGVSEGLVVAIAKELPRYQEMYEKGVEIAVVTTRKCDIEALSPQIKSEDYLSNVLARVEADRIGVFEGIMLDNKGNVSEGTISNIFIVNDHKLITSPVYTGALPGITRSTIINLAKEGGIEVAERNLTRYDLYNATECFLTFTSSGIIPVIKIDGQLVNKGIPGKVTKSLFALYKEELITKGTPII